MGYLTHHWSFDPFLVLVAVVAVLHEVGLGRLRRRSVPARNRRRRWHSVAFYAGLAVLVIAVVSPIDYWSRRYFFVHMVEHILISFYAPILIVAGAPWLPLVFSVPVGLRRRVGRSLLLGSWSAPLRSVGRIVSGPWFALVAFNLAMVLWHLPALFDGVEDNSVLHVWVMDATFLVTGVLFWLQIISSFPFRMRASPLWQMGAIISTNIVMFVLAMSLSIFTAHNWYPLYDHLRGVTLSPFADQQIGAAILWICGDFWAIPALIVVVKRAVDQEGSLSNAVDRILHRGPAPTLEQFRPRG